jgi:hypothetical protein
MRLSCIVTAVPLLLLSGCQPAMHAGGGGGSSAPRPVVGAAGHPDGPSLARDTVREAASGGGLYGTGGWSRLAASVTDGVHPGAALTWASVLSHVVEFRTEIAGVRRIEGALPGIGRLAPISTPGNFATQDDPVWDFDLEAALNFYVVQPTPAVPIGFHAGGFGNWVRYLGSITPSAGSYSNLSYGAEVGGFYRSGNGSVVRVAVQFGQIQYRAEQGNAVSEGVTNLQLGIEPRLGALQLGGWLGQRNNQRVARVGFVFR